MAIMVKVILKRIWRAGIVSVGVLAAFGSVGGSEVHSHSHRPETKVMALVPDVSSQQHARRSYPEGNRTLTADSGAAADSLYSQFRRARLRVPNLRQSLWEIKRYFKLKSSAAIPGRR